MWYLIWLLGISFAVIVTVLLAVNGDKKDGQR